MISANKSIPAQMLASQPERLKFKGYTIRVLQGSVIVYIAGNSISIEREYYQKHRDILFHTLPLDCILSLDTIFKGE